MFSTVKALGTLQFSEKIAKRSKRLQNQLILSTSKSGYNLKILTTPPSLNIHNVSATLTIHAQDLRRLHSIFQRGFVEQDQVL